MFGIWKVHSFIIYISCEDTWRLVFVCFVKYRFPDLCECSFFMICILSIGKLYRNSDYLYMSIFQLSKIVYRKHAHSNAIKYILSSICVWTYAYSLSSLFKFLELKLLLHQIPYFMQTCPLYVPYAHARNFIFIEKSVRSCTTKDTFYLIHIESNMGAFASKLYIIRWSSAEVFAINKL